MTRMMKFHEAKSFPPLALYEQIKRHYGGILGLMKLSSGMKTDPIIAKLQQSVGVLAAQLIIVTTT